MATENLQIKITAIDKTRQAFNNLGSRLKSMKGAFIAVVASAGLVVAAIFRIGQSIDNLAKTAARIGFTANELQSLRYAAQLSGASTQELDKGMQRFARTISEANVGLATAQRAFDTLGISVKDQDGNLKGINQLLEEVLQNFNNIESPAERVRVAFELFGRSGEKLTNMLMAGSDGVDQMRQKFEDLTIELTERQTAAVQQANDNLSALGTALSSLTQQISAEVLPVLVDGLVNAVSLVSEKISEGLSFWAKLGEALGLNTKSLQSAADYTKTMSDSLFSLKDATEESGAGLLVWTEQVNNVVAPAIEKATDQVDRLSESYIRLNDELTGGMLIGEFPPALREVSDEMERIIEENDRLIAGAGILGAEIPPQYEAAKTALQEYGDAARDTFSSLQDIGVSAMQNLEDALLGVVNGTTSAKDAFKSMALSIINDLIRMQIRQSITGPLSGLLGSAMGSVFGGFGGGGSPGAGPIWQLPRGRAVGGSVSRNSPYMVGEKGPELFVPGASGTIVRNEALSGQGGGQTTIVNQTIQIETGVSQTVRAEIMSLLPQIKEQTKAAVLDSRRRGGQFAAAFR